MRRLSPALRTAAWSAIPAAVAVAAVMIFLDDLFPDQVRNLVVAVALVAGAAGTTMAFRRDSVGRGLMCLGALMVVCFLIIYDVLDVLLDPFMRADWPIAVGAMLLVTMLKDVLAILVFNDE